ncbi:hypothetical protein [Aureimonas sp. AU22]|uniref:hypothetical protein n=1 Tax=Aureimonas sp. AU22 TaxID=1638162 RepID=UPI0007818947|nr:hypothetical protein [Aureimonas sp. AU22]
MRSDDEEDLLRLTLSNAGLKDVDLRDFTILAHAGAVRAENARVHAMTNRTLSDTLDRDSLGVCIHVTGGARALTDPNHRRICETIQMLDREPFQVLYHEPLPEVADEPWGTVAWNMERWHRKGFTDWRQKLLTLNMIGAEAVNLKAYDERERLQFSVFGGRYSQVQSAHADEADAKHVWLVESEAINGCLTEFALADLAKAREVEERIFDEFVSTLYGNSARRMLMLLMEHGSRNVEQLLEDRIVRFVDPDPARTLSALRIMSFMNGDESHAYSPTTDGRAFLESA